MFKYRAHISEYYTWLTLRNLDKWLNSSKQQHSHLAVAKPANRFIATDNFTWPNVNLHYTSIYMATIHTITNNISHGALKEKKKKEGKKIINIPVLHLPGDFNERPY